MVYEFPMLMAVQCIPIFNGLPEELDPFLNMVRYFASKIPEGEDHTPLLSVVYIKLKGKALNRYPFIKAKTWPLVEKKLIAEFKNTKHTGELIKDIETLFQGPNESFNEYKIRAEALFHGIEALPAHGIGSYVDTVLRLHFLAGLRSRALALSGTSQRDKVFPDLLSWLENEYEDEEVLKEFHKRVHPTKSGTSNRKWKNNSQEDYHEIKNGYYEHYEQNTNIDNRLFKDEYKSADEFMEIKNSLSHPIKSRDYQNEYQRYKNNYQPYNTENKNNWKTNNEYGSDEILDKEDSRGFYRNNCLGRFSGKPQDGVRRRYQDEENQEREFFKLNRDEIDQGKDFGTRREINQNRTSSNQSVDQLQNYYDHVKQRNVYLINKCFEIK